MPRKIAILGCGPAGLLCAHAADRAGIPFHIYSRRQKSVIPGSQYLHQSIPGLTSPYPEGTVQYVRIGDATSYALKVYDDPERETGWGNYLAMYPSWNVIKAYDALWDKYLGRIIDLGPSGIRQNDNWAWLQNLVGAYDCVISTLPAPELCYHHADHQFEGVPYYIKTLPTPKEDRDHDIVVYNGLANDSWYRWSILGGTCSIEYAVQPAGVDLENDLTWRAGTKAIHTNCDCFRSVIERVGRWAEWRHGVLLHHAFQKTEILLEGLR